MCDQPQRRNDAAIELHDHGPPAGGTSTSGGVVSDKVKRRVTFRVSAQCSRLPTRLTSHDREAADDPLVDPASQHRMARPVPGPHRPPSRRASWSCAPRRWTASPTFKSDWIDRPTSGCRRSTPASRFPMPIGGNSPGSRGWCPRTARRRAVYYRHRPTQPGLSFCGQLTGGGKAEVRAALSAAEKRGRKPAAPGRPGPSPAWRRRRSSWTSPRPASSRCRSRSGRPAHPPRRPAQHCGPCTRRPTSPCWRRRCSTSASTALPARPPAASTASWRRPG